MTTTRELLWIDHESVPAKSGEVLSIENPATEELLATVPRARRDLRDGGGLAFGPRRTHQGDTRSGSTHDRSIGRRAAATG